MKRKLLSVICILSACWGVCMAQDVIITRDAKKINAKVIEVSLDEVKYKNFSNPDGPTYTLPKSKIASILYTNGEVETFETTEAPYPQPEEAAPATLTVEDPAPPAVRNQPYVQPRRLSGSELLANMQKENPALYRQYQSGRKQAKAGSILLISGGALTLGGLVLLASKDSFQEDYDFETENAMIALGVLSTGAGMLCMTASIPFTIIGSVRKGNAMRQHQRNLYGETAAPPQLRLNLYGNGLGLAYVF